MVRLKVTSGFSRINSKEKELLAGQMGLCTKEISKITREMVGNTLSSRVIDYLGKGSMTIPGGHYYEGEFKNDKSHGMLRKLEIKSLGRG